MTRDDIEFVKGYRKENEALSENERPPCLECTDEKIVACSKIKEKPRMGCADFLNYMSGYKKNKKGEKI